MPGQCTVIHTILGVLCPVCVTLAGVLASAIEQRVPIACASPPLPARAIAVERLQASFRFPRRPQIHVGSGQLRRKP